MKPSRHIPNEFDAYGEGELLLIGAGMWLGLLFSFIGKLLVRGLRAIARNLRTLAGFALGCLAGFVIGVPLWWYDGLWLRILMR